MVFKASGHTSPWISTAEMSSLSAQMALLEKKLGGKAAADPTDVTKHRRIMEEPTALLVSDQMSSSCLRAPPPSLKSDSDLENYFRANIEATSCQNANAIMMPDAEPSIRNESDDSSAIQREYDLDTWKMYHRIQSSRKQNRAATERARHASSARVVSDNDDEQNLSIIDESRTGMSFQEQENDNDEGIFELELDL
jgi:hypothetical protein